MRPKKASLLLALAATLLVHVTTAGAAPTVIFQASAVPIPSFPDTGNLLGAGAALDAELRISGTEYGGYPPPLIGMNVSLPQGAEIVSAAFPTCSSNVIAVERLPGKCPRLSKAGPKGTTTGFVVFGSERVPETMTLEPFYAPGGGIDLYIEGHTPASIELATSGRYVTGAAGFGPELMSSVPLIETVPGAPDASISTIDLQLGSAIEAGGETLYYTTMPRSCPKGFLPFEAELTFAGLGGLTEQIVTADYRAPCPGRSEVEGPAPPQTALPGTGGVVTAPSNSVCVSRRHFTVHVVQIKGLVYRQVSIALNGRAINAIRGARITAPIDLRGLPKGRYTLKITVTTAGGRRISGTRTYHTCAARPIHPTGKPTL